MRVEVARAFSRAASASASSCFLVAGCDFRDAMRRRSWWRWRDVFGLVGGGGSAKDMDM